MGVGFKNRDMIALIKAMNVQQHRRCTMGVGPKNREIIDLIRVIDSSDPIEKLRAYRYVLQYVYHLSPLLLRGKNITELAALLRGEIDRYRSKRRRDINEA